MSSFDAQLKAAKSRRGYMHNFSKEHKNTKKFLIFSSRVVKDDLKYKSTKGKHVLLRKVFSMSHITPNLKMHVELAMYLFK